MKTHDLLLGELKEFRRHTITELERLHKDMDALHSAMRSMKMFKKKITVTAGLLSGLLSFAATIAVEMLRR